MIAPDHENSGTCASVVAPVDDREPELDGLRALAACMVALLHCFFAVGMPSGMRASLLQSPVGAAANGSSAVILFFVLSGYVLAGSFARSDSRRGVAAFYVRRLLRIYPAWLAALAAAWLGTFVYPYFHHGAGVGQTIRNSLVLSVDTNELLQSAFVPGLAGGLMPAGWTLPIELALSFALPALFLLAGPARGGLLILLSAAGLALAGRAMDETVVTGLGATVWKTVEFALPFSLGIVSKLRLREHSLVPEAWAAAVAVTAVVVFLLPPSLLWAVSPVLGIGVPAIAGFVLIRLARTLPSWRRALGSRALVRMGELSYGFYLLHYTVICFVAPFVFGDEQAGSLASAVLRWIGLFALVVPIAFSAAAASYRWIETPAIAAGRSFSRRILARSAYDPAVRTART